MPRDCIINLLIGRVSSPSIYLSVIIFCLSTLQRKYSHIYTRTHTHSLTHTCLREQKMERGWGFPFFEIKVKLKEKRLLGNFPDFDNFGTK